MEGKMVDSPNTFGVVGALFRMRGDTLEVLLVTEDQNDPRTDKTIGMKGLPAGWVKRDESAENAVVREFLEETGMVVKPLFVAGIVRLKVKGIFGKIFIVELASQKVYDDHELATSWWPVSEVLAMDDTTIRPGMKEALLISLPVRHAHSLNGTAATAAVPSPLP